MYYSPYLIYIYFQIVLLLCELESMLVPSGGGGVEEASPQWYGTVPYQAGIRVADKVPCALHFSVPTPEG